VWFKELLVLHFMQVLGIDFAEVLSYLFLLGCGGCVVVLLLSFWEDAKVIAGFEE
jgi:hypothetical protein